MISAANEVEQTSSCAFPSIEWDSPPSNEFQAPNGTAGSRKAQQLVLDSSIAGSRNGGYGASLSGSLRSSAGKKRRRRSGYNRIIIPKSLQFALSSLASSPHPLWETSPGIKNRLTIDYLYRHKSQESFAREKKRRSKEAGATKYVQLANK
jgi:hypothetical protein